MILLMEKLKIHNNGEILGITKTQKADNQMIISLFRRDTRIRTWDPLLPKQVR